MTLPDDPTFDLDAIDLDDFDITPEAQHMLDSQPPQHAPQPAAPRITYTGKRLNTGSDPAAGDAIIDYTDHATERTHALAMRLDLAPHCADFDWGKHPNESSAQRQLAIAILAHCLDRAGITTAEGDAQLLAPDFELQFLATANPLRFTLTSDTILAWFNAPAAAPSSPWTLTAFNAHRIVGRECSIEIQPRPHYCDRGNWLATIEATPGSDLARDLDGADMWPRYFFDLDRAKLEIEAWLRKRGQWVEPTAHDPHDDADPGDEHHEPQITGSSASADTQSAATSRG